MRTYEELVKEAIKAAHETATKAEAIFEVGHTYEERYIGDSSLKVNYKIIKRTAKTVTIEDRFGHVSRCKIYGDNDGEYTYTSGRYSMAPVLRAIRKVA